MTKITIPRGTDSVITIPAKPEYPVQPDAIERIGVNVRTAAEMLGVCERTMWTLAQSEKVRTTRVGKRVIFSVQSLREFIDGAKNADNPDTACVAEGKERL